MGKIFGVDSKLIAVLNRIVDIVLLNVVFLITCIPVVTIGTSLTALYSVTLKMVENRESYIFKSYLQSWRANFKQATIIWMIQLVLSIVLYVDFRICVLNDFAMKLPVMTVLVILWAACFISMTFAFPILAKFEVRTVNAFVNSLLMPLSSPLQMVTVLVIVVAPVVIALNSKIFFLIAFYLLVMGWFSLTALANSFFLNRMFRKFLPEEPVDCNDERE